MYPQPTQEQAMHMFFTVLLPIFCAVLIVIMAIIIIPLWQICKKAGFSGPLSLLTLIPGIGMFIVLYVVAFSEWKVVSIVATGYPPTYPPPSYPPQSPNL
jgi:hypothetical protein